MADLNRRTVISVAAGFTLLPFGIQTAQAGEKTATHTVEITGFKFVPAELTVHEGDTILWVNKDIAPHTATATDDSWDTGSLKRGETAITTVGADTVGDYYCRFHPHMQAALKLVKG